MPYTPRFANQPKLGASLLRQLGCNPPLTWHGGTPARCPAVCKLKLRHVLHCTRWHKAKKTCQGGGVCKPWRWQGAFGTDDATGHTTMWRALGKASQPMQTQEGHREASNGHTLLAGSSTQAQGMCFQQPGQASLTAWELAQQAGTHEGSACHDPSRSAFWKSLCLTTCGSNLSRSSPPKKTQYTWTRLCHVLGPVYEG
jgi:hypothetical protein